MNERIKKIAEQYKDEIRDGFEGYEVIHWCNVEDLIHDVVRECIKLSQPPVEYPVDGTWIEKSYWEGCYDSSQRIKEHFGVEK